ncbi:hypothetical protein JKP88DRAFT_354106 [Tribonema minus]|uniref:Uncharacterized protein n=1 Tax=Tribonema minus TaxID=303371 RepID=A0A835Z4Y4_9STRA|nr:hypothetical protein JKP88DRAFT_354106 [Tribonema minus]
MTDTNTVISGSVGSDLEAGRRRKRRVTSLAEAIRYRARGRIIARTRRKSQLPDAAAKSPRPAPDVDEHLLSLEALAERYAPPLVLQYLRLLRDPLTAILLVAAALSLASQAAADDGDNTPVYLGLVLLAVTLANTTVDFVQARKMAAMVKSLAALAPPRAVALRGGAAAEVGAAQLARGDVVLLKAGDKVDVARLVRGDVILLKACDKVPADIRLIKTTGMAVDNSNLTGEGDPQARDIAAHSPAVLEAANLLFMGTTVVTGAGVGVVIRRGDDSVIGRVSVLAGASKDDLQSPLTKEMKAIVLLMGGVAFCFACVLFIIGMTRGFGFTTSLSISIGVFVAFALTGMPATVTMVLAYASRQLSKHNFLVTMVLAYASRQLSKHNVTMVLAYASRQLSKHNVLVKNLHAMDTLGAITLLCSDKTGTLTMNVMTVVEAWRFGQKLQVKAGTDAAAALVDPRHDRLTLCMALCNSAHFVRSADNMALPITERAAVGDATETALLRHVAAASDVEQLRRDFAAALEVPFSSDRKWAAGVFRCGGGRFVAFLKGAPERVIRRCAEYYKHGADGSAERCPMDDELSAAFQATYERMAGKGQRVIACATLDLDPAQYPESTRFDEDTYPFEDMVFLGLVALQDPPKPGVTQAIDECNTAGIQVMMITGDHPLTAEAIAREAMMITGDHPLTAEAIAREVHIIRGRTKASAALDLGMPLDHVQPEHYDAVVLHGETLAAMSEDEWAEAPSKHEVVFARTDVTACNGCHCQLRAHALSKRKALSKREVVIARASALSKREVVFARTSPQQKLEIVTRAQAMGHVVGMIGDGVNDSPALRRADMGIAMALTGSEVSREAASLILLDDNFTSVVVGIRRGRVIFRNMKKAICCTLGHIMAEIVPAISLLILGLPLGLSAFLILFIDLGTEIAPVMSFAFEDADADVMRRPPRRAIAPRDVVVDADEERHLQKLTALEVAEADDDEIDAEADASKSGAAALWSRALRAATRCAGGVPFRSGGKEDVPANPADERLVDMDTFYFAFVQNGFFGVVTGLVVYFLVFNHYGVPPSALLGAAPDYFPATNGDNFNFNGGTLSSSAQDAVLSSVQSAYYFTIVVTQFFTAHILKATGASVICSRAACANKWTYVAMAFSAALACVVTLTPGVQTVLGSRNFPAWAVAVAAAGGAAHVAFESAKRFVKRALMKKKSKVEVSAAAVASA